MLTLFVYLFFIILLNDLYLDDTTPFEIMKAIEDKTAELKKNNYEYKRRKQNNVKYKTIISRLNVEIQKQS